MRCEEACSESAAIPGNPEPGLACYPGTVLPILAALREAHRFLYRADPGTGGIPANPRRHLGAHSVGHCG